MTCVMVYVLKHHEKFDLITLENTWDKITADSTFTGSLTKEGLSFILGPQTSASWIAVKYKRREVSGFTFYN